MTCGSLRKIITQGILIISIILSVTGPGSAENICPDSAQQYWKKFRQAVLQSNSPELTSMVQFPLEVRGSLDDSKSRKIIKDRFNKILSELLATDPGLSVEPTTMGKYIQGVETLPVSSCNKRGNQFRVGSCVFELNNNQWYLVLAFIDNVVS